MDAIPVFYCGEVSSENDPSPSLSAGKPRQVVAAWELAGLPIDVRPVVPATPEDLSLAHDPGFVRRILACEEDNGFGNNRADLAQSLLFTNGAMLCAASFALQCGVACAPAGGFHHAEYAVAKWFCTFNGLMVAALRMLRDKRAKRVLILDTDQHFGDGTEQIISHLGVTGVDNVTFGRWFKQDESRAGEYLERLEAEVQRFSDFDLILYHAGVDVHRDDPLGGVLSTEQLRERERIVFSASKRSGVPIAWALGGGYQPEFEKVLERHTITMKACVDQYVRPPRAVRYPISEERIFTGEPGNRSPHGTGTGPDHLA